MREQRINALKAMLDETPLDPFALDGVALEYKSAGDLAAALPLLETATALPHPEVYAFYQQGEVLMGLGELSDAANILEQGLDVAREKGEAKAIRELQELRDTLD